MSTTDRAGQGAGGTRPPTDGAGPTDSLVCRPAETTPVAIDADQLESTAESYLADVKAALLESGRQPAHLVVAAAFEETDSIAIHRETDRLRRYVRAASFLGAGQVTFEIGTVSAPERVEPAVAAVLERARREGIAVSVSAPEELTVSA